MPRNWTQADIDSLLGSDTEAAAEEQAGGEELSGELDQADIDSLLGDSAAEEGDAMAAEEGTIDQEEMDRLFGSSGGQESTPGDEVDFAEILGDQEDASPFSDFDADAFSLEPEEDEEKTVLQQPGDAAARPTAGQPPASEEIPEYIAPAAMAEEAIRKNPCSGRLLQVPLGVFAILLLGGGGAYYYFGMTGAGEKKAIVTEEEKPACRAAPAERDAAAGAAQP